ncbi:ABC transporter substrate-binding protein [Nocardioides sp. LS1]|uniref:ABC transporter substrate-binding protein n=1 Tax=Nocardioides sp. LS1 TaxID=1027620 RepID=UPI000F61FE52|nr:ABC transporter substrate-binding protein [Nocardioides sp. LS1]GCD88185.1 ABC transporter substrate-binding protein [Nocardioides sp. LS1]
MSRPRPAIRALALGVSAVLSLSLAACSSSGADTASGAGGIAGSAQKDNGAATDGTIKIGLLSTLDGPFAVLGEVANQGAKLALVEAGATLKGDGPRDGVSGLTIGDQPVELSIGSSDATPDSALAAAKQLVEKDGVDILVGPLSGDEGLAIKEYAKQHPEVTFVNGTSGAQNTTLRDPASNFFRFTTDGAQWMAGLGDYAASTLGYKSVVTIGEDYSFPYDQVGGFMTPFCAAGGTVPDKIWVPIGTKDFSSFISQIPDGVDALYVALGGADALNFTKQLDESSLAGTPIIGGTITADGSLIAGLGDRAEGIVSAGPVAALDTPEYAAYAKLLKATYPKSGPPGLFDTGYYTEMKSTLMALDQVDGKLDDKHVALNDALANLTWTTPTGPVKLDENRQAIANNYLFKVENGSSVMVDTIPNVDETLGFDRADYIAKPANDRDHPSCS